MAETIRDVVNNIKQKSLGRAVQMPERVSVTESVVTAKDSLEANREGLKDFADAIVAPFDEQARNSAMELAELAKRARDLANARTALSESGSPLFDSLKQVSEDRFSAARGIALPTFDTDEGPAKSLDESAKIQGTFDTFRGMSAASKEVTAATQAQSAANVVMSGSDRPAAAWAFRDDADDPVETPVRAAEQQREQFELTNRQSAKPAMTLASFRRRAEQKDNRETTDRNIYESLASEQQAITTVPSRAERLLGIEKELDERKSSQAAQAERNVDLAERELTARVQSLETAKKAATQDRLSKGRFSARIGRYSAGDPARAFDITKTNSVGDEFDEAEHDIPKEKGIRDRQEDVFKANRALTRGATAAVSEAFGKEAAIGASDQRVSETGKKEESLAEKLNTLTNDLNADEAEAEAAAESLVNRMREVFGAKNNLEKIESRLAKLEEEEPPTTSPTRNSGHATASRSGQNGRAQRSRHARGR